ncbi:hypothetical protein EVG20_g5370 [Dentipellis fragilis]|uniref:DUF3669 domain-containing protein n=1 Tax=Dentipellis fragilis TaxID=205917 RepID=A0A4Y9YVI0_9AGAM|nr:hypothetical protein EVG20_g5370 [Dentipellis fragilis]
MASSSASPPADNNDDSKSLVRLGVGSFGAVYVINGGPVAYKQVHQPAQAPVLLAEYKTLNKIYEHCKPDSFFDLPRALAYNNPLLEHDVRPIVTSGVISIFPTATNAMDRVHALPLDIRSFIKNHFFLPSVREGPLLCRQYFGKVFPPRSAPPKFVNNENFPLDVHRYELLSSRLPALPRAQDVAAGMGEMLGIMHNLAGVDARDAEFVLGGDGAGGCTIFTIDFNQASQPIWHLVREWSKAVEDVGELVQAFFVNDPYYPRSRPDEPLYEAFEEAYLQQYDAEMMPVGLPFLRAIEQEQAARDERAKCVSVKTTELLP